MTTIPSSGIRIPSVGIGTNRYRGSVGSADMEPLKATLETFFKFGGRVIDTSPNYGSLCVKGRFGFNFIHSEDRLKTPLVKENGIFREATWDEALDLTAKRLSEIKKKNGPDSIGVLTSARVTNEDNYAAMKFTRAVLKTNNIDHCARL